MKNNYDIFISYKLKKILPTQNCWHCFNVVYHKSSLGVPLVLFGLFYRALKWIRSAFLDEPSGHSTYGRLQGKKAEREESPKVMRRYTQLTNISSLVNEIGLVTPQGYVLETIDICRLAGFDNSFF